MRLVIAHDSHGNVINLAASPEEGPLAYPPVIPGMLVTQVDAPDIKDDLAIEQINNHLADLVKNYRVEVSGIKAKLLKK